MNSYILRSADLKDGRDIWKLVRSVDALELNTPYAYLVMCDYFSDTTIVTEYNGKVVGFVGAFKSPKNANTLFIWQIGVAEEMQGCGLAKKMLNKLIQLHKDINYIETTVVSSNIPSKSLFLSFAEDHNTSADISLAYGTAKFPDDHEPENLFKIGPIR